MDISIGKFLKFFTDLAIAVLATIIVAVGRSYLLKLKNRKETVVSSETGGFGKAFRGFLIAISAGFFWGVGNVITRYTVKDYPAASFDVSFIKYLMAGSFLVILARIFRPKHAKEATISSDFFRRGVMAAAFVKGLESYVWVLSAAFISAAIAATLENLHVLWTLAIIAIFGKVKIPREWFASTISLVVGVILITQLHDTNRLFQTNMFGLLLAWLSGLLFAIFTVTWSHAGQRSPYFWHRTMEMGCFMLLAAIFIYPFHFIFRAVFQEGDLIPLMSIPPSHILIQAASGLFSLAITYLLINESLYQLKSSGKYAGLLLGLGLSYSVFFTILLENIWFGVEISLLQWIGIILFSLGFTSIRQFLTRSPNPEVNKNS